MSAPIHEYGILRAEFTSHRALGIFRFSHAHTKRKWCLLAEIGFSGLKTCT